MPVHFRKSIAGKIMGSNCNSMGRGNHPGGRRSWITHPTRKAGKGGPYTKHDARRRQPAIHRLGLAFLGARVHPMQQAVAERGFDLSPPREAGMGVI